MIFEGNSKLNVLLNGLFETYLNAVPDVKKTTSILINNSVIKSQSEIVNDHIAFRTLGLPNLGIQSLEKIFLHFGYQKRDYYQFEEKKLNANWYAPPSEEFPRVFISELKVHQLSQKSQDIILKYTQDIFTDPLNKIDLENTNEVINFFTQPLWKLPNWEDYESLRKESEYAAWVIYNRYYLNHYTISVHELKHPYNQLEIFNSLLKSNGIVFNNAGGEIKTSGDGLLKQSSTVAQTINAKFSCGNTLPISGSYVEFAERLPLPEFNSNKKLNRNQRREGFETSNADKIFESTFTSQTKRK